MKELLNRVSVPGRILDLLWADDEFYRDVGNHKKVSSAGKFPRCDQWCDEDGFHMAFALAGYSPGDVAVSVNNGELCISGLGNKVETSELEDISEDEYPAKAPKIGVQRGMIVRGIARRNFKAKYFINPTFNLLRAKASMKNGLLEVLIPKREKGSPVPIDIKEI
jgi:HSP20 family molecular chaperone IbpA